MNSDESQRWIEAGIAIGNDPKASIPCPRCRKEFLDVVDIYIDSKRSERRMRCPHCGAQNFLLFASNAREVH